MAIRVEGVDKEIIDAMHVDKIPVRMKGKTGRIRVCHFPSDHLTPAQKKKLSGPVQEQSIVQYTPADVKTWLKPLEQQAKRDVAAGKPMSEALFSYVTDALAMLASQTLTMQPVQQDVIEIEETIIQRKIKISRTLILALSQLAASGVNVYSGTEVNHTARELYDACSQAVGGGMGFWKKHIVPILEANNIKKGGVK